MWEACYEAAMATLSLDLRERIVRAYDKGDGTRDEIAQRFDVSLGMVKSSSSSAAPQAASSPGIISPDARSSSWPSTAWPSASI
jgi:transposase-like protein